jgi:hypothetical protein
MYVEKNTEYQNSPVIKNTIEVLAGGATVATSDFNTSVVDELKAGAIVGEDENGLFHHLKTAKLIDVGEGSALIEKLHTLKVGDIVSDGVVALEISAIDTSNAEFDILSFDSGDLTLIDPGTILYQVESVDTEGSGTVATATVEDDVADTLTVTIPVKSNPASFNGINVVIEQAADDNLAVAYEDGTLTISLAKTTASKNNASLIEAAVQALGVVAVGIDFSLATVEGSNGWDGNQTGDVLTSPEDELGGGTNYGAKPFIYTPVGVTLNAVDLTKTNQTAGVMVRGTVNEINMPQYVNSAIKAQLPLIRFEYKPSYEA